MVDIFAEIAQDAMKAPEVPTDEKLEGLAAIVNKQLELEQKVADLEEFLRSYKKELLMVQTRELPNAMQELGYAELKMADGSKITVKPFVSASIPKDKKPMAYAWLNENGHGDLIKHIISVNTGKDQEQAEQVRKVLSEINITPSEVEKVEPQTLKVFIRGQVEAGQPIPLELFGAYLGQKATIKKG
jgi:DNA-binding protein H-NS